MRPNSSFQKSEQRGSVTLHTIRLATMLQNAGAQTLSPLRASMPNIVADAELPEKLGTGSSRFTDASNIKKMRWEATSVTAAGRTRA